MSNLSLMDRIRFHLRKAASRVMPPRAIPSHEEKRRKILGIAERYKCSCFVESGTFTGDTVAYMKPHFRSIVSIELGAELAERAQKRFEGESNVRILQGDSGEVLAHLVPTLGERAFFWLDGHYSHSCTVDGETLETAIGQEPTPVLKELAAVLADNRFDHVVVIDDARLFTGRDQYPTIREIRRRVHSVRPGHEIRREDDMIIVLPNTSNA